MLVTAQDLSEVMGPDPAERRSQKREFDSGEADVNRLAVLIVDDVPANLLALEGMLRRNDLEIVTAPSGSAALEILLERDVAVAIIDVQMPEMNGFELAELMRGTQKTRNVPIIFVTAGSRDQSLVFRGYESGAVDYLFKPLDPQILRGKVEVFVTLEQRRQQLEYTDRLRELFIAILGHDLRNPLSSILMAAELILRESNDEVIGHTTRRILQSGDRMVRLIDELLDLSRLRLGGGISLSPEPTDLREVMERVLNEFEDIRERFRVAVSGDTVGSWDRDRMLQVASNLIGNAVRHSPSGSPIRIQIQGEHPDQVVFRVYNVGEPIPEKLRGVIFEPFHGSSADRGLRRQGLGLGLYIARQIAIGHGGTLSLESSDASGTCFRFHIPRHR